MRRSSSSMLGVLTVAAIALAGCGSSSKPGASTSYGKSSGGGAAVKTTPKTAPTNSSSSGSASMVITAKSNPALEETILAAGPKKLTVYMFAADHGTRSACYGACASAWPPLTTTGKPQAGAGVQAAKIGTVMRTDGTKQVTYAGHPLYYYAADSSEADITGQGVNSYGALWYVLSAKGAVITKP